MKKIIFLLFLLPLGIAAQKNIVQESSAELIQKGIEFHDQKKYYEAIQKYKKVSVNDTNYFTAQFEMALTYIEQEEWVFAQKILKNLISLEVPYDSKPQVFKMLAQTYEGQKNFEEAMKAYDDGLKLYPMNHSLYFSKGITCEKFDKHQEAIDCYKKALKCNMNHPGSHLRLGNIAAREGQFAQSLLSLMTFLLLEPTSERSAGVVQLMENIANGTFVPEPKGVKLSAEGDDFENINLFFQNKVALQDNYKVKLSFPTDYAKQFHLVVSSGNFDSEDPGYWAQTYFPVFKNFLDNKQFDNMILFSLQSIDNAKIQKKVKSKRSAVDGFINYGSTVWAKHIQNQKIELNGQLSQKTVFYSRDGIMIGDLNDGGKKQGVWYIYHPEGNLNIIANYDNGEREGLWTWHDFFTNKAIEASNYSKSQLNGSSKFFYASGELKEQRTYKDDILQDTLYLYYRNGQVKEKISIKDGKRNGINSGYWENGSLKYELNYKDNVAEGPYKSFHANGVLELEFDLKKDKIFGKRKEYYANGKVMSEYEYNDEGLNGPFVEYHANGQVTSKGVMKNGKNTGLIEEFYPNGIISTKANYDENGKENGTVEFFDMNGKKVQEFTYSKGMLNQIKNFNKAGEVTKTIDRKGKKIQYEKLNSANRSIKSEGLLNDDKRNGKWNFYDVYGNLIAIENYNNEGNLEDSAINFYPSGKVKYVNIYKNGERDGIHLEYNSFGELTMEGMYKEGNRANDWYEYFADGSLKEEYSFKNGELHGYQKTYAVNGKLYSYDIFDEGRKIASVFLDTLGNPIQRFSEFDGEVKIKDPMNSYDRFIASYKNGEEDGPIEWKEFNRSELKGQCTNGYRQGTWTWFHPNGKTSKTVNYVMGMFEGKSTDYHENGKVSIEGNYVYNQLEGEMKYYYENGKLEFVATYLDDERHGKVMSYAPSGELQQIRYYDQGLLLSYSYPDKTGKEVTPIDITKNKETFTTYYQSGAKAVTQTRVNGELDGIYYKYLPNGKILEEENYQFDERHGKCINNNENGGKLIETDYKWGDKHGLETKYYANGKIEYTQEYLFDKKHGVRKEYNQEGKLVRTIIYYNDEAIKQTIH